MKTSEVGSLRISAHCSCGASFKVSSNPPRVARNVHAAFVAVHRDLGHHPVDAAEGARIRRKQRKGVAECGSDSPQAKK